MKHFKSILFLLFIVTFGLQGQPMTKIKAPEFPGYADWLNTDQAYKLADFRGKFVLLDFWTYCCINCIHVLPDLKALEQKYANELVVIGVHSPKFPGERETANIRQAILRYEIEHPVINDYQYSLWKQYSIRAWPTTVLIDPQGYVVRGHSGENVWNVWDGILEEEISAADKKGVLKRSLFKPVMEPKIETVLSFPGKVFAHPTDNVLIISDSNHNRILIVNRDTGAIQTVIGSGAIGASDGDFENATFNHPQGIWQELDKIYIADTENHLIRVANLTSKTVLTLAGTGKQSLRFNEAGYGTTVGLNSPWDLLYHDGLLYVAMAGFHQVWTIDPSTSQAQPWLGSGREDIIDGTAYKSALAQPSGLTSDGKFLYFADSEVSAIRKAEFKTGTVQTLVGEGLFDFGDRDGVGDRVRLQHALGVVATDNKLFIADTYNNKIKELNPDTRRVVTFAGTGKDGDSDGAKASFDEPGGIAYAENKIYIADTNNHLIRVVDTTTQETFTLEIY